MIAKLVELIHPLQSLIGLPFFGNNSQNMTGHNELLNNAVKSVMRGNPSSIKMQTFNNGERLNTGYPIAGDKNTSPRYFLFVITPTSSVYSKINDVISMERLEMFPLITGFATAVMFLIIFLILRNSVLDKEVKRRTNELEESNKQLSMTNTKLEAAATIT